MVIFNNVDSVSIDVTNECILEILWPLASTIPLVVFIKYTRWLENSGITLVFGFNLIIEFVLKTAWWFSFSAGLDADFSFFISFNTNTKQLFCLLL